MKVSCERGVGALHQQPLPPVTELKSFRLKKEIISENSSNASVLKSSLEKQQSVQQPLVLHHLLSFSSSDSTAEVY